MRIELSILLIINMSLLSCSTTKNQDTKKTKPEGEKLSISFSPKESQRSKVFPGHTYNFNYSSKWIYDISLRNNSGHEHCSKIKCFTFRDDITEEDFLEKKKAGLSSDGSEYMVLATEVYSDPSLMHTVGEIITVYRNVFKDWKENCELTHSYPDQITDPSFQENIKYNFDIYENMGRDSGPCHQYFFDGMRYHKIDLNQFKVQKIKLSDKEIYRLPLLDGHAVVYSKKNFVFKVNSYDQKGVFLSPNTNYTFKSIYGHEQRDWSRYMGKVSTNDEMLKDFLKNGSDSIYAGALSEKMPISIEYNDSLDQVLFRYRRRLHSFKGIEDITDRNPNCDPSKSYHGKFLTPYGVYHCLIEHVPEIEYSYIDLQELNELSRSSDFPHIATYSPVLTNSQKMEIDKSHEGSTLLDGKKILILEKQGRDSIFTKIRSGFPLNESDLDTEIFDDCHKIFNGVKYSCEFVDYLEFRRSKLESQNY